MFRGLIKLHRVLPNLGARLLRNWGKITRKFSLKKPGGGVMGSGRLRKRPVGSRDAGANGGSSNRPAVTGPASGASTSNYRPPNQGGDPSPAGFSQLRALGAAVMARTMPNGRSGGSSQDPSTRQAEPGKNGSSKLKGKRRSGSHVPNSNGGSNGAAEVGSGTGSANGSAEGREDTNGRPPRRDQDGKSGRSTRRGKGSSSGRWSTMVSGTGRTSSGTDQSHVQGQGQDSKGGQTPGQAALAPSCRVCSGQLQDASPDGGGEPDHIRLYKRAKTHFNSGQLWDAIADAKKSFQSVKTVKALLLHGRALTKVGKHTEALESLEEAEKLSAAEPGAQDGNHGMALVATLRMVREKKEMMELKVRQTGSTMGVQRRLAEILAALQLAGEARQDVQREGELGWTVAIAKLEVADDILGTTPMDVCNIEQAYIRTEIAELQAWQGNNDLALESIREGLQLFAKGKRFVKDRPSDLVRFARIPYVAAAVMQRQGKDPEGALLSAQTAKGMLERVREEKRDREWHRALANVLEQMGLLYMQLRQMDTAEQILERAVGLVRDNEGSQGTVHLVQLLRSLAKVKAEIGRPEEGLALSNDAARLAKHILGSDNQYYGRALSSKAIMLAKLGKLKQAMTAGKESLKVLLRTVGEEDQDAQEIKRYIGNHFEPFISEAKERGRSVTTGSVDSSLDGSPGILTSSEDGVGGGMVKCSRSSCQVMKGKNEVKLYCGSCRMAMYCGKECQKLDWKEHKVYCQRGSAEVHTVVNDRLRAMVVAFVSWPDHRGKDRWLEQGRVVMSEARGLMMEMGAQMGEVKEDSGSGGLESVGRLHCCEASASVGNASNAGNSKRGDQHPSVRITAEIAGWALAVEFDSRAFDLGTVMNRLAARLKQRTTGRAVMASLQHGCVRRLFENRGLEMEVKTGYLTQPSGGALAAGLQASPLVSYSSQQLFDLFGNAATQFEVFERAVPSAKGTAAANSGGRKTIARCVVKYWVRKHSDCTAGPSIYWIWVSPDFRQKGIGSWLHREVERWVVGTWNREAMLQLKVSGVVGTEARGFFEKIGYELCGDGDSKEVGIKTLFGWVVLGLENAGDGVGKGGFDALHPNAECDEDSLPQELEEKKMLALVQSFCIQNLPVVFPSGYRKLHYERVAEKAMEEGRWLLEKVDGVESREGVGKAWRERQAIRKLVELQLRDMTRRDAEVAMDVLEAAIKEDMAPVNRMNLRYLSSLAGLVRYVLHPEDGRARIRARGRW
ncbi:hypothetical protein CBR_g40355 [Chara braunii]|uniref:MYND-type domain-containing protein n=1 Tax=Chara braunii TaxID=69332 RepID=A0A388LTI8_CHABU|nr:hypothetical protein CBR_g40355 [Chara braunii]|eukprot:GBG85627.1 hypothetical protein CBR_g40355 [Chara braunii]